MKKTLCDFCESEITGENRATLMQHVHTKSKLKCVVQLDVKAVASGQDVDICKYCAMDWISQQDDRPKGASK